MGIAIGGSMGFSAGFAIVKSQGLDPFSGRLLGTNGRTVVQHHTNPENMKLIKQRQEIFPSRLWDYDFYGVDFEATPNFKGRQSFGNFKSGSFIEMSLPNHMLNSNPSPMYNHYYRANTGILNLHIRSLYNPQYFRNL